MHRIAHPALLVALGAVVLAGCSLLPEDEPRVLVIGDSVTQMSTADIEAALEGADVRATLGLRTDELVPDAEAGAAEDPDVAIVVTGYNDLLQGTIETDALRPMADALAEVPCVIWVTLPEMGDWEPEAARRWNERIRDVADDRDTMHVTTEWQETIDSSAAFRYLFDDRVHPDSAGRRALAGVMERAIDTSC